MKAAGLRSRVGSLLRRVTSRPSLHTSQPERAFRFEYSTSITEADCAAGAVRVWIPLPRSDPFQSIGALEVRSPIPWSVGVEASSGNRMLFVEVPRGSETVSVFTAYDVLRRRVQVARPGPAALYPPDAARTWARHLGGNEKVPVDGFLAEQARSIATPADPPVLRLRKLFDHLMETLEYDTRGCTPERAGELGDLPMACDLHRGTCTEFHGLLVAYCRALGMPARFEFGFNVPFGQSEGAIAGYHCWAQVLLPEVGWFPVDVTEALKELKRGSRRGAELFFGGLNCHRLHLTDGRDLPLTPPAARPIDKLIFSHAERAGEPLHPAVSFAFRPPRG